MYEPCRTGKSTVIKSRSVDSRNSEEVQWKVTANGLLSGVMKMFSDDGIQPYKYTKNQ
jgi:hypothetical protein